MTIASTVTQVRYSGNLVTTQWSFNNKIFQAADLDVAIIDGSGVVWPFTNFQAVVGGTLYSYTVQNIDVDTGCSITLTPAIPSAFQVDIRTTIAELQSTSIKNQGSFLPELHEEFFDKATRMLQDLFRLTYTFGIHGPDSETVAWPTLPSKTARALQYLAFDSSGNIAATSTLPTGTVTPSGIGLVITPISAAEIAAGVTVVNNWYPYGNVLRYGIVPNLSGGASSNSTILTTLLNPSLAGPTGLIYFPNTTGADIYYFGNTPIQVRDGCTVDLNGCTLNFSGVFNSGMASFGFLTFIRNVTVQNGTIQVNYNGTGGPFLNNGYALRIGSRSGYGFGTFPSGIFDQDNLVAGSLPLQGGCVVRNLRITSNNPGAHLIFATGGLRNLLVENVWLDGQSIVPLNGFYYEYGWSSTNGQPGTQNLWSSSHMTASCFRNVVVTNLAQGATSQGFGFNGAYDCTVEDIYVNGADQGFGFGTGEAMFYRVWGLDVVSPARQLTLRDLTAFNLRTVALSLGGSNAVGGGYLAPIINGLAIPQRYQAQTDLLSFSVDGFSFTVPTATGTGVIATGSNVALRNGVVVGGAINIGAECMSYTQENVQVLNSGGPNGVRFGSPVAIWSPTRPQMFAIRGCKICGSTGAAIATAACQSAIIENNQLGYNTQNDVAAEATQTNGVNLAATSFGVKCRGNAITTAGGANAYQSANNTVNNMNSIENERITQTTGGGGAWDTDFQSPTAQVITTGGTINCQSIKTMRLNPAAAVTGVIMPAGQKDGQPVILINEATAANTITFAASGTSRVSLGTAVVIAGGASRVLYWDSAANLWY